MIAHESGHIVGGHLARLRNQIAKAKSAALMLQILAVGAMVAGAVGGSNIGQVGMGAAYGGTDAAMRMVLAYRQDKVLGRSGGRDVPECDKAIVTGSARDVEFMRSKLFGVQGLNPYLQSHPLPAQRLAQLRNLAMSSSLLRRQGSA